MGVSMTAEQLVEEMPAGLIKWYDFAKGSHVLYVTADQAEDGAILRALAEYEVELQCHTPEELDDLMEEHYDYVLILSAVERTGSMEEAAVLLGKVRRVMKENGILFLGMDNRLGIRYFCGDRDPYTGRSFDGIENYIGESMTSLNHMTGRCFAKAEMTEMLERAGFVYHRFYSVFPLLSAPQCLFAEDYIPKEQLDIRIFPQYNYPDTVFLEEQWLYDTLLKNGLFHTMANGFWIECPLDGRFSEAEQITMSMDRGKENAMFTMIRRDHKVEKKAIYKEGCCKSRKLMDNQKYLTEHGIAMVEANLEGDCFVMPYVDGVSALEYLRTLALSDRDLFVKRLDELWEMILSSSEQVPYSEIDWDNFEPYWGKKKSDDPLKDRWKKKAYGTKEEQDSLGVILKRGYIDLVPLNCFWIDETFVFYDQEIYVENLPAKVIMLRTIDLIFSDNWQIQRAWSIQAVKERYGLMDCSELFYKFISKFLDNLRNDGVLAPYHKKVRKNAGILNANRQRMNYSADVYERLFRDIFRGAENRDLYLFGSGVFAERFISQFGRDYHIAGILDNNPQKWGIRFHGIAINSPEMLRDLEVGTYKVIICIKNYMAVMHQLEEMGITDLGIYDSSIVYPRKVRQPVTADTDKKATKKKYHTGYIAGVFDLFHMGHLNMFRRAKELCDYLIVGVVTDEGVIRDKKTLPYIPFAERVEIVRACRYVDEVVEIPPERSNTDEAYRRYQFDVQFSGSDYENDAGWQAKKEFLQKNGSDMVFFPYTQSTSSTKLKSLIEKKLL